jgi:hypothetical protein
MARSQCADDEQGQALPSIAAPWQAALHEGWAAFCGQSPCRRGDYQPGRDTSLSIVLEIPACIPIS